MKLKAISRVMLTLLLIGMLTLAFNIQPVKAKSRTKFTRSYYEIAHIHPDSSLAFGDFDSDGDIDFLEMVYDRGIFLFINIGNMTFERSHVGDIGWANYGFGIGDFDGDGDLDFLVGDGAPSEAKIYLFFSQGPQTFARTYVGGLYGAAVCFFATGDFDGDGDIDFIAGDWSGDVFLFTNSGDATFVRSHIAFVGENVEISERPVSVASGDFDGDGDMDFVAGRRKGDIYLFTNRGDATFTRSDVGTEVLMNYPYCMDFDTDGDIDFIIGTYGGLAVYWNITPIPRTWTVDDDGPADFHTIQEAINAASPGDTIYVYNGTYYENVVVNESVSLIGENKHNTIIDGSEGERTVLVTADDVTVKGFKIQNGLSGVELYSTTYSTISDNNITSRWPGYGVSLSYSHNNTVEGNNILDNKFEGITLSDSNGNNILGNNITRNNWGIELEGWCRNNTIEGNKIAESSYYGIYLGANQVYDNIIRENTIANSEYYGIYNSANDNIIYHNNFINNKKGHVVSYEGLTNTWDDGYPSGGNYWDYYTGLDEKSGPNQDQSGSDGVGDTPYTIDESNQDNYPLMSPWGLVGEVAEEEIPLWTQWWLWTMVATGIVVLAGAVYFLRKRKPPTPTAPTVAIAIYKRRLLKTPIH